MKSISEEKIRIGNPNDKKAVIKAKKSEIKTGPKSKANTKIFENTTQKNSKIKSKSSCILKTVSQTKNNQSINNLKLNVKNSSNISTANTTLDKFKKNRSLDQVTKVPPRQISKTTLSRKVSIPAECSHKSKLSLYAGFFSKNLNNSLTSPTFTLDNYCRKLNSFGCHKNAKFYSKTQPKPGKSMSYDSLNTSNERHHLSKCLSSENGKNIETEKPIGVFNIQNKSYIQTPEAFLRKTQTKDSVWSYQSKKPRYISLQELLKNNNQAFLSKPSENSLNKSSESQISRDSQIEKQVLENRDFKWSLKNDKQPNQTLDSVKKYNELSWQGASPEKRTVKICQCLHFHTEDGFKKLCIQNNTPSKEFGHKFFRVNYFSKKDDKDNEKPTRQVELIDKGTTTEYEETKKLQVDGKNKRNLSKENPAKGKVIRKSSSISKPKSKIPSKVTSKSEHKTQILNSSTQNKGKLNPQNTNVETKKNLQQNEECKLDKAEVDQKKALDELEVLEKLFLKLNSVERALVNKKFPENKNVENLSDDKNLSEISHKNEKLHSGNVSQVSGVVETNEDYLQQRNNLRNAIGIHVQNLLKLDFDIS